MVKNADVNSNGLVTVYSKRQIRFEHLALSDNLITLQASDGVPSESVETIKTLNQTLTNGALDCLY
jgi:hypothetical protein